MSARSSLLASIANTIKDYRKGEIPEPTPDHVDRWISQFDPDVHVPMLQELNHVFKQIYLSRDKAKQSIAGIVDHYSCDFWRDSHILDIQQKGNSQAEIRELVCQHLRERWGSDISFQGSLNGDYIYLDDAIFTGRHVINDLSVWIRDQAPERAKIHILVFAFYTLGEYWININKKKLQSGKQIDIRVHYIPRLIRKLENRLSYRDKSVVLWPTADVYPAEGFQPRNPVQNASIVFDTEQGRQLLEREFLNAGSRIRKFAKNPSSLLKPLGYSNFEPGFGSLFVTYRNCPNNCPLALWYGDPSYPSNHPFGRWYPLFPRKTYSPSEDSVTFWDEQAWAPVDQMDSIDPEDLPF